MSSNSNPGTHSPWAFSPSLGASILFLVLFALTTLGHLAQAIVYRKPYCAVIVVSGLVQTLTYSFRTASIQNFTSLPAYEAWFILILIAPLFTNAFVYMVFGRMVWNYAPGQRIWKIRSQHFSIIFVVLDIIALIIQVYGAAMAATSNDDNTLWSGLHTYMGGMGIQQLFILIFCLYAIRLFISIKNDLEGARRRGALQLLIAIFAVLGLITLRICFRLDEYSQGIKSTIPNHEAYQYGLDSLHMLAAIVLFNVVHPGRIMAGQESEPVSTRKRSKRGKKEASPDIVLSESI